jgi:2-methylcitrate dehydratase PrpD
MRPRNTKGEAMTASQELAAFAAGMRLEDVPADVLQRAKACIADTIGCAVYGARLPWSAQVAAVARRYGAGPCDVFGSAGHGVQAPFAALANGAAVHAFEQDSLRFPGAGVHPGAALVPAIAAACQETGADGATALRAFVAGCEVLFRIGAATHHSSEKLGFHAPGLTGVYGAAIAAGLVYGLSAQALAGALGNAGSMSAGLLAFSKSAGGAEVKRLHMGRACEAGILAARLAQEGFAGPETILEGRFGFLEAYCRDPEPALLTAGLGTEWETRRICLKRYACHVTAQAPLQALRALLEQHAFAPQDVAQIELECAPKVISHHDIRAPQDVMQAQYSVPFCLALGLHRDPLQPSAFDASALRDAAILATCASVQLRPGNDLPTAWSARIVVVLRDGRRLAADARTFRGMPGDELSPPDERERFDILCESLGGAASGELYAQLASLETQRVFPAVPAPLR